MLRLIWLAVAVLLGFHVPIHAAEAVHFDSAVFPPSPLKLRLAKAEGKELQHESGVRLWGHLHKPDGNGPYPAVVLMHGCAGIYPSDARWASLLTDWGYVTLILDSFRPRSIFNVCKTPVWSASPAMRALDAHGALAYLKGLPYVDPARIGVAGWSHGGISALGAVSRSGVADRFAQRFKAAVAFYPYCINDRSYDLPVLILIGVADDWTPVEPCQELHA